jgi:hypothetical protein
MTSIPPLAASQAGATSGGGLLDFITGGSSSATQAPPEAGPAGDGSVGLFDGVFKKALLGGAVGAGIGFLPFLPGGPILGGIVGALAGAGYGIYKNFKEMKTIQTENQAFLASAGVQINDPMVQQALVQGNPQQILQIQAEQAALGAQQVGQQGVPQQGVPQVTPGQSGLPPSTLGADPMASSMPGMGGLDLSGSSGGVVALSPDGSTSIPLNGTAAPPPVQDPATQPTTQTAAAVTPAQAELAAGGGDVPASAEALAEEQRAAEERVAAMWLNATPEEQEALLARLQQRLQELEDLVEKLQRERQAA